MAVYTDKTAQRLAQAKKAYRLRDFPQARLLLEEIIQNDTQYADAFNMLGVIYHDAGLFSKAQKALEQALEINPRYIEAALNLSVLFNDLGQYEQAHKTYQTALAACQVQSQTPRAARCPDDPFAAGKLANLHAELAEAYRQAGKLAQACQEYEHALELGPDYQDLRIALAQVLLEHKRPKQAVVELEKVLQKDPHAITARLHLGIALLACNAPQAAIAQWERILKQQPEHQGAAMYIRLTNRIKTS